MSHMASVHNSCRPSKELSMLPAECVDEQLRAIVTRKHEALADAVFAVFAQNNASQVSVFRYCTIFQSASFTLHSLVGL